jgi:hypothetical protein
MIRKLAAALFSIAGMLALMGVVALAINFTRYSSAIVKSNKITSSLVGSWQRVDNTTQMQLRPNGTGFYRNAFGDVQHFDWTAEGDKLRFTTYGNSSFNAARIKRVAMMDTAMGEAAQVVTLEDGKLEIRWLSSKKTIQYSR